MSEIEKQETNNATMSSAVSGNVVALFKTEFVPDLTPNTARDAGNASLTVVSARMSSRRVPKALKDGDKTKITLEGAFLQLVPANGKVENVLREYPDGTRMHISEESDQDLLTDAPKPAIVNIESRRVLSKREISRRFIINIYSTSADPANYGIADWFKINEEDEGEKPDNLRQFPANQQPQGEEKRAA